jgi:mRNA interferase MazF
MRIERGTVVLVDLDPTLGREQRGLRPSIAVSDPDVSSDQRFPLIAVVPLTGTEGVGALYPPIEPGASGLAKRSCALIDQVRAIDKHRVRRVYGRITPDEIEALDNGLCLFLGLPGRSMG